MSYEGHVVYSIDRGWTWYILQNGRELCRYQDYSTQVSAFAAMYERLSYFRLQYV